VPDGGNHVRKEAKGPQVNAGNSVADMWARFKATGDKVTRDELIVHYAPLVKYVAGRVGVGLPPHVDPADLVSYGMIGLIDAIDKFDPDRSVKFETYASNRIKGAILDELRATDWVPRSVRSKARALEEAQARLQGSLKRMPTDAELASELGVSEEELGEMLAQMSFAGIAPLDELIGEGISLADTVQDQRLGPSEVLEVREARRLLGEAISELGERERDVLALYYFENLSLAQIGDALGVSESRACQIHGKAVIQLRVAMRRLDTGKASSKSLKITKASGPPAPERSGLGSW
jgi:RNA polymerase sigma factor for flagellar operon FliA